jgi:DNA repair protein RecO (recombination protein O)
MLIKTHGIVLRFVRYSESSVIVTLFTRQEGLQSYLLKGIRSSKSTTKMALFQPLNLLELVAYHREQNGINHIKESKCYFIFKNLNTDLKRQTIGFFLVEIMNKAIREQSHTEALYQFLESTLIRLDTTTEPLEHFPILFLIELSQHLGFGLQRTEDISGHQYIPDATLEILQKFFNSDFDEVRLSKDSRRELMDILLNFYKTHIEHFGQIKSIDILRELLQ